MEDDDRLGARVVAHACFRQLTTAVEESLARRHEVLAKVIFLVEIDSALNVATFILVREATVDNSVALDRLSVLALQKIRDLERQVLVVHGTER